jgi:adenine-specific DNA-methyltransferase
MPESKTVEIKPAKGRPMLTWVGKRSLRNVLAYPAQLVETYSPAIPENPTPQSDMWSDWPEGFPRSGLLYHGDNKDVLAYLLATGFRGKIKLVYIDPPFDSGADYVRKVQLRGNTMTVKFDGESYGIGEQIQYTDIWSNDNYLQFIYERLTLLKELLSEDGSIYVHCDWRKNSNIRLILDEIFGSDNFRNEIIWKRKGGSSNPSGQYDVATDTIYWYSKSQDIIFHQQFSKDTPEVQEYIKERFVYTNEGGRKYMRSPIVSPNYRENLVYEYKGYKPPPNGWSISRELMEQWDQEGRLYFPENGERIYRKIFLDEYPGQPLQNLWTDIFVINPMAKEREDYPTQKPVSLLQRIIQSSSNPGDIVLDCFLGSGTTAYVAQTLGRRWIGCDINKGAIQTTSKRLSDVIKDQVKVAKAPKSPQLIPLGDGQEEQPKPSQLSFTVFRVNDYDLQIQHNEALNLACEHIGITRTKTDVFFDGTLGNELAKIIPFNHPLTLLDLQEIHRELENRPEEERNIVVVCLGKELATQEWVEDWNKNRKRTNLPNQIRVIEVRSDPKYGGLFLHKPAEAEVSIQRTSDGILVEILDFISPTIIERLSRQAGLVAPKVEDWRAMVDSIMIDAAYNGEVFNIVMADIPEKKTDLVSGKYHLPAPNGQITIAVKITDMLGEEVLVTKQV